MKEQEMTEQVRFVVYVLVNIIAIVVVGVVAVLRGRDQRVAALQITSDLLRRPIGEIGWARGLLIVGLIPLGLQAFMNLIMGAGEIASGDLSAAGPALVLFAATVLQAVVACKRPIEGGIALLIVGIATSALHPRAAVFLAAPQIVCGGLFLVGAIAAWRATTVEADKGS
jgi:hypothetical protein